MYRSSDRLYFTFFNLHTEEVKCIDVAMASLSSITFRRANVSMYRSPAPSPTGSELRWSNLTHPLRHGIPTKRRAAHISTNGRGPRVRFSRKSTNQKRSPKYSYQSQSTYSLHICWLYVFESTWFQVLFPAPVCSSKAWNHIMLCTQKSNDFIYMFPLFPYEKTVSYFWLIIP